MLGFCWSDICLVVCVGWANIGLRIGAFLIWWWSVRKVTEWHPHSYVKWEHFVHTNMTSGLALTRCLMKIVISSFKIRVVDLRRKIYKSKWSFISFFFFFFVFLIFNWKRSHTPSCSELKWCLCFTHIGQCHVTLIFLVYFLYYEPCHIPLKYRRLIKKSDHTRPTTPFSTNSHQWVGFG